jgi:hypothetical protein
VCVKLKQGIGCAPGALSVTASHRQTTLAPVDVTNGTELGHVSCLRDEENKTKTGLLYNVMHTITNGVLRSLLG